MLKKQGNVFGFLKTSLDAHTMGIEAIASLLNECGYIAHIAPNDVEAAMTHIYVENQYKIILQWIRENDISFLGFSYRLDPYDAVRSFGKLIYILRENGYYENLDARIKDVCFSGLLPACDMIREEYNGHIITFAGGESPEESLLKLGIPFDFIPNHVKSGCEYDRSRMKFAEKLINSERYKEVVPHKRKRYTEFGTKKDSLELRIQSNYEGDRAPVIRSHAGPYHAELSPQESLLQFLGWCTELAKEGLLDVLSIGTSQLSQSHFGEDWNGLHNGGGVPVNSEADYDAIWQASRPMLVRTYAGTKHISKLAELYDRSINMAWHALSLWWFNVLDGRGPNSLYHNLQEHLNTIRYIASTKTPFEANIPHHFAFRGCDDITYIVSAFLAAKLAKRYGIKLFVLANMLNTPRSTWGIQDLAKSRAMLSLIKALEDKEFHVVLQTRTGLDFFRPDIEIAKVQLAATTALMDDIDPYNQHSPEIIHVVGYSEALFLATPAIINDSIRITKKALTDYRQMKALHLTFNVMDNEIQKRKFELEESARKLISAMEEYIPDLYSPEGFYLAFVAGWLPVPKLWLDTKEFVHAQEWDSRIINGGVKLYDGESLLSIDQRIHRCATNMPDAIYNLKSRYQAGLQLN